MLCRIKDTTAIARKYKGVYKLTLFEGKNEICRGVPVDTENDPLNVALSFAIEKYRDKITADSEELAGRLVTLFPIDITEVLPQVDKVIDYGLPGGMDVFISGDVFRLDGDAFTNPHPFELWYTATKHRPVNINPADYKLFVSNLQSMSNKSMHDPISTSIIDRLTDALKSMPIYTDTGIDFFTDYTVSRNDMHAYLDKPHWVLYVTKSGMSNLAEVYKISQKRMREYLAPYLAPPGTDEKWIGDRKVPNASANVRMWMLDYKKLVNYDSSLKPSRINLVSSSDGSIEVSR
jgi:hypothetical protein